MKKQVLSVIAAMSAFTAFAQLPVSTDPENKKTVLEEYTGYQCGYCPDGHRIATALYNSDPDNVVLINIHTGGYADPGQDPTGPDLRCYGGTQIAGGIPRMGIAGYPAGDVNRTSFPGTNSGAQTTYTVSGQPVNGLAGDRGAWTSWSSTIAQETAYCNVALEGWIDTTLVDADYNPYRVLTVYAQVYFTANSPVTSNSLTIVLLEDSIRGPQHNYGNPYYNLSNYNADGTYNHNHVMRDVISPGSMGKKIPVTTAGTTFTTMVTYTVPFSYGPPAHATPANVYQMHLAAFVTETGFINTVNANHGPIGFRTETVTGINQNTALASSVSVYPNPSSTGVAKVRVNAAKATHASVKVYDQIGRVVYEAAGKDLSSGSNEFEINTQNLSSGLYLVSVKSTEGTVVKQLSITK